MRTLRAPVRDFAEARIRAIAANVAAAYGAEADVFYDRNYPVTRNHAAQAGFAATVLGRTGLPAGLVELPGLPSCGTAEMCLFGDAEGRSALVDPLVGFIRDSLEAALA